MSEFFVLMWGYVSMGMALGFGLSLGVLFALAFHLFSNAMARVFLEKVIYPITDKYRLWKWR
ncbi:MULTISPECIES: hypothetical protein [Providencia]|uniref:hypothetical protein n=1 Tax=Providencia TaxID=586 RepID=UPI0003E20D27|nr:MULTISPECIES: hypothetical protein [Providencia]ETS98873.1 hypothetical protein HMPREF1568_3124 [Providencia alcalifaciens PAL-3]ETT05536.1 hypothetical protein HMPREF1562_1971 [Providencia alcalifaciens F90-2004]EUC99373.1 hypothetical protein HMPREF1566_0547 [Providencia alcalifaciens PAL-1]MTC21306.1 hypothetical protein [Providencia sp. wls1938]MTC22159.1 hypothetical protein [Providencia sp. wls1938]